MTREEAKKQLVAYMYYAIDDMPEEVGKAFDVAISALSENKGEWIDNGNGSYTCSNCKTEWTTSQIEKMCFCPTCGNPKGGADKAESEGKQNDTDYM